MASSKTQAYIKILKQSGLSRPFTTKEAYYIICNATVTTSYGAKLSRKKVPNNTNQLSKIFRASKEVRRTNELDASRPIAFWEFVE